MITLEAVNAETGDVLAREQVQAESKEGVLKVLGRASSRVRSRLGESLASIAAYDTPIEQATTASLEALKAYSTGPLLRDTKDDVDGLPFLEKAIALDPNFAMAHARLGTALDNLGESQRAREAFEKAFALRDRRSIAGSAPSPFTGGCSGSRCWRATRRRSRETAWLRDRSPGDLAAIQATVAVAQGRLREARRLRRQDVDLSLRRGLKQAAAFSLLYQSIFEMLLDQPAASRALVDEATSLGLTPGLSVTAAAVLGRSGAAARASVVLDEAARQRPEDTLLQRIWLPHARAYIELGQGRPERAFELVRDFGPYEAGLDSRVRYTRAEIQLARRAGPEAEAAFGDVLARRGEVGSTAAEIQ